jgi:hypothetical protein
MRWCLPSLTPFGDYQPATIMMGFFIPIGSIN